MSMSPAWENYLMVREVRQDLSLTEAEQRILQQWSYLGRGSGAAARAAIVLMASTGLSRSEIASRLHVTRPTVAMWIRRFQQEGLPGLRDRARPGRRRTLPDSEIVLRTLTTRPRDASIRAWSSRSLATELGVSNGTVARVWRRWGLRPARLPQFHLPTSPELSTAGTDLVGLYCDSGNRVLLLNGDERGPAGPAPGARRHQGVADVARLYEAVLDRARNNSTPPAGAGPADLVDILRQEFARYPSARLRLLVEDEGALNHPAVHHWMRNDRLVLHRATAEPAWVEMVVVLVGVALFRRTGDTLTEHGRPLLDALRELRRIADGNGLRFWWGRPSPRLSVSAPSGPPAPLESHRELTPEISSQHLIGARRRPG